MNLNINSCRWNPKYVLQTYNYWHFDSETIKPFSSCYERKTVICSLHTSVKNNTGTMLQRRQSIELSLSNSAQQSFLSASITTQVHQSQAVALNQTKISCTKILKVKLKNLLETDSKPKIQTKTAAIIPTLRSINLP